MRINKNVILSSKQIELEPLSVVHLKKTMIWANDIKLHPLILRNSIVDWETHLRWYDNLINSSDKIVFAIIDRENRCHLGNTGFYHYNEEHKRAEFWILIGEHKEWRKGIGKTVLSLMLEYGFTEMQLNKIYLMVSDKNEGALQLYRKMGFKQEGIMREHYIIHGKKHNVIVMSILRRELFNELQK